MQVFMPSKLVRWDEVRIPARGEDGELTFVKPVPDAVCVGFIPLFATEADARERFSDPSIAITAVTLTGAAQPVEEDSPQQDDEKHESRLEEGQA